MKNKVRYNYFFNNLKSKFWLPPLNNKGFFDPEFNPMPQEDENNPGYYWTPYWAAMEYLKNIAIENEKKPAQSTTEILIKIVNSIIDYKTSDGQMIENYHTDRALLIIISTFPLEKIEEKHIEFIKEALSNKFGASLISSEIEKTLFPKFLKKKDTKIILKLLNIIFDYKKPEDNKIHDEYSSLMDKYWLNQTLKKYKSDIAKLCAGEAAKVAINKIKTILSENERQFNNIWIPAIEDNPQNNFSDRYECQLVFFVRDMLDYLQPEIVEPILKELIKEKHPIFKRIAIHIINRKFDALQHLLFKWQSNPLDEIDLKHELFELCKINSKKFTKQQIESLINWIESLKISKEIKPERREKYEAGKKKEWYIALLDSEDSKIIELYEKYNDINPTEIKHPGFVFWSETSIGERSPITVEDLVSKSNEAIADYLREFKQVNEWDEPTEEGLTLTLEIAVKENIRKFVHNLQPFLYVKRKYQAAIIRGFIEAWRMKKECEWQRVFEFIKKVLSRDEIWQDQTKDERYNYRNWLTRDIADFIHEGCRNDDYAFAPELFPIIEEILFILVNKTKSEIAEFNDLVTSVLSSGKGQTYVALLSYSLRWARLYRKDDAVRWKKEIKELFIQKLDPEKETSPELWVTLGQFLGNLFWLDKEWAQANINKIFPKKYETVWRYTITGYLFHASKIFKGVFETLKVNGHYSKAISTKFSKTEINDRLVGHICLAYTLGWEDLSEENSLISKLINNENADQYKSIVQFFLSKKTQTGLKPLWAKIHPLLMKNISNESFQIAASKFLLLLAVIDEIDDNVFNWVKDYIPYFKKDFNLHIFIETLARHVKTQPKFAGDLLLALLENNVIPEFENKYIITIVDTLYRNNLKVLADKICIFFGEMGILFLRDIYERNQ